MPELPDIQVFKEYLDATLLHQQIEAVEVRSQQVLDSMTDEQLDDRLRRQTFESARRYGKYLFAKLDGGDWLSLHFGMTDSLEYFKSPDQEPEYTHFLFNFANDYHLAFTMPRKLDGVKLVKEKVLVADVLDNRFDFKKFCHLLDGQRGMIKSRLMGQHIMAGIGNVYSDEILCQARVHPRTDSREMNVGTLKKVFYCLKEVLQVTIENRAHDRSNFPVTISCHTAIRTTRVPDAVDRSNGSRLRGGAPITAPVASKKKSNYLTG